MVFQISSKKNSNTTKNYLQNESIIGLQRIILIIFPIILSKIIILEKIKKIIYMINIWYFFSVYFWTWNMVPSLVYILLRWPLRLSFLPKKAISLFFAVKLSLLKTLQLGNEFFLKFFLLVWAFFASFLFIKWTIVFFELFFDTLTRWHA